MSENIYQKYCIGEFQKGDVLEFLKTEDVDDNYRHEPRTLYFLVSDTCLLKLREFDENVTGQEHEFKFRQHWLSRIPFGEAFRFGEFDGSYIQEYRKVSHEYKIGVLGTNDTINILPSTPIEWWMPT